LVLLILAFRFCFEIPGHMIGCLLSSLARAELRYASDR
jgi:hypothetical protein